MNHTHAPSSYSFVHPAASRIKMTSKPSTADSRVPSSPFKSTSRIATNDQNAEVAGRSPMRRQMNFSSISPLKDVTSQQQQLGQHKISSKLESTVSGHSSCQPPPQTQIHAPRKSQNISVNIPNELIKPQAPVDMPLSTTIQALSRQSNKIIEEKKNAIDQIISNCTQLNFGHSSKHSETNENSRQNEQRPSVSNKLQSMAKIAASPMKHDDNQQLPLTPNLKKVRTQSINEFKQIQPIRPITIHSSSLTQPIDREGELRKFIARVNALRQELSDHSTSVDRERQQLALRSLEQRQIITKTYQQLFTTLKQYETKDLNQILYYQEECLRTLTNYQQQFREAITRLDLMNKDITPNIHMIKAHIDEQQYKTFMADYRKQIEEICSKVQSYEKNVTGSTKPEVNAKDLTKLAYDIISLIDYPQGFNKSTLYFSFEGKTLSKKQPQISKILVQDHSEAPLILINSDSTRPSLDPPSINPPFRALFNEDKLDQSDVRVSPTFKKL